MSIHGLLLINKPKDITSHDVVARVRRLLKMREVGHAGTLDPLASGLMVILLGEGTKLSDYILNGNKGYRVRVKFGVKTDTLDMTGQVLRETPCDLDPELIVREAKKLEGQFSWPVPIFSAVKTGGKKLYEMARAEEVFAPPVKEMSYWNLKIIEVGSSYLDAYIECSKGSFIRTWADQLGEALGVGGAVEALERVSSAPYKLDEALDLPSLETLTLSDEYRGLADPQPLLERKAFIRLSKTLPEWRTLTVKGKDERLIHNGQISYDLERRLIVERRDAFRLQKTVGIKVLSAESGNLLSIIEAQPNRGLKIRRVFKMT